MSNDGESTGIREYLKYPRDLWQYLRGPGAFFATLDLNSTHQIFRSLKHLSVGLGGTVAFSGVNLKLSDFPADEGTKKLFEGSVLANAMLLSCLVSILIAHFLSWAFRGKGKLRRTFVTFAYTYAFTWPIMAVVMISMGWYMRFTLGVPWTELPPFSVSQRIHIEWTFGNVLIVAVPVTVYLWMIVLLAYAYVRAVMDSHEVGVCRALAVAACNIVTLELIGVPLGAVAHKIASVLDPILRWFLSL